MVNWDLHYPMLADLLVLAVDLRPHGRWNVVALPTGAGCRAFHLIGSGCKDDSR